MLRIVLMLLRLNRTFVCAPPAETLPHEENGLMKEQRYMDSASNSMTPRPQAVRSSSEYHAQYHPGNGSLMRRLSSNPTELGLSQPHRRVEGTATDILFRILASSFSMQSV